MMVAMLTYPFTKNKNINILLKILTKKQKTIFTIVSIICIMKIVETWRLFFQFYFFTSEGTGSAIRGRQHTSINLTYIFIQNAVFPRSFLLSFIDVIKVVAHQINPDGFHFKNYAAFFLFSKPIILIDNTHNIKDSFLLISMSFRPFFCRRSNKRIKIFVRFWVFLCIA